MKTKISFITFSLVLMMVSLFAGMVIHKYKPYQVLRSPKKSGTSDVKKSSGFTSWSIGIYSGSSLLNLADSLNTKNPVLKAADVTDIEAAFVADPFVLHTDSKYYMFFEVLNKKDKQGDIGVAESTDGKNWKYKQIVLDEKFHLSYPYVFEWNHNFYMIPESHQDLSVRLYKASAFPTRWEYMGDLLKGYHFVDSSIIRYKNKWWLFVSIPENDVLNLYFSDKLMGPWKQHPLSPVVKHNKHIARCGGRLLKIENKLYRFAQDDDPTYGNQVHAFEIVEMTETAYREKLVSDSPVVKATASGWNALGMHHVDVFQTSKIEWLAVVDGFDK